MSRRTEISEQTITLQNGRNIVMALRIFAQDNGSNYPDAWPKNGNTANAVFLTLFKEDVLSDERIFGCPNGPFVGDGIIGQAPNFDEAVGPGENHWMLVGQQNSSVQGDTPIVFENALDTSWPPKWRHRSQSPVCGCARPRAKVLVSFNDNTARPVELREASGGLLTLPDSVLKPLALEPSGWVKVLHIEERK